MCCFRITFCFRPEVQSTSKLYYKNHKRNGSQARRPELNKKHRRISISIFSSQLSLQLSGWRSCKKSISIFQKIPIEKAARKAPIKKATFATINGFIKCGGISYHDIAASGINFLLFEHQNRDEIADFQSIFPRHKCAMQIRKVKRSQRSHSP